MSTTFRPERAAEAIHEAVAKILNAEVSDPRLQHVTIMRVEVTDDLSFARIYYVVRNEEERYEAGQAFERATPFLRGRVGQEVPLRTVPELSFRYDKGVDNAARVAQLLAELPELQNDQEAK
jgi:ribosome-binding factor A